MPLGQGIEAGGGVVMKPKPKPAGAVDKSLDAKADAVISRMSKPKPVR